MPAPAPAPPERILEEETWNEYGEETENEPAIHPELNPEEEHGNEPALYPEAAEESQDDLVEFAEALPQEDAGEEPVEFAEALPQEDAGEEPVEFAEALPQENADEKPVEFAEALPQEDAGEEPVEFAEALPQEDADEEPVEFAEALPQEDADEEPVEFAEALPQEDAGEAPVEIPVAPWEELVTHPRALPKEPIKLPRLPVDEEEESVSFPVILPPQGPGEAPMALPDLFPEECSREDPMAYPQEEPPPLIPPLTRPPVFGGLAVPAATEPAAESLIFHPSYPGERNLLMPTPTVLHLRSETTTTETPERTAHVKGCGAHGYFQVENSMAAYTKASFLQQAGAQFAAMTRFSLAAGSADTPDTCRNVRRFSTKLHTDNGIFDLLCSHLPVFSTHHSADCADEVEELPAAPETHLQRAQRFWAFVADRPECIHFATRLYSDLGTVKSYRHIRAYSVNTHVWVNRQGRRRYVKYHWIPMAGEQNIDRWEAARLAGENPDVASQDLYNTIAQGIPVEYELRVQILDPQAGNRMPHNPLDVTKAWDETRYPLYLVGRLVLNRNPVSYPEEIGNAAFSYTNLREGIEYSGDRMLWGHANSHDGGEINALRFSTRVAESDWFEEEAPHQNDFAQAGEYYHSITRGEQNNLIDNIAVELHTVPTKIQHTVLDHLDLASPEFAARVYRRIQEYMDKNGM